MVENVIETFEPIFVVGASRSGTTMMGRILNQSEKIFTFRELHFFEQLWSNAFEEELLSTEQMIDLMARLFCIQHDGYLTQKSRFKFYREAECLVRNLLKNGELVKPSKIFGEFLNYESKRNLKQRPCEQTPRNVFYLKEIFNLYPNARVINMIRDPRDVLLSQKKKWKRRYLGAKNNNPLKEVVRSRVNYHPIIMSKLWSSAIKAAENFRNDKRVLSISFEGLLTCPEKTLKKCCDFLNIAYSSDMLEIRHFGSSITPDHSQPIGLNKNVIGGWKRPDQIKRSEIYWCQKMNRGFMKTYGYKLQNVNISRLQALFDIAIFPVQMVLALLLNVTRMKHFFSSIKKRFN